MTFAYPGYEQYHHYDGHDLHGFDGGFGGEEGESDYGHHQIANQRIGHEVEHGHEYHHEEDEHVDYYVSFYPIRNTLLQFDSMISLSKAYYIYYAINSYCNFISCYIEHYCCDKIFNYMLYITCY